MNQRAKWETSKFIEFYLIITNTYRFFDYIASMNTFPYRNVTLSTRVIRYNCHFMKKDTEHLLQVHV